MKIKNIHVIIAIIVVLVIGIGFYCFNRISQIKNYNNNDLEVVDYAVYELYETHPELFVFDEYGECIISVQQLLENHYETESDYNLLHDSDGNDCVGYYIVTKTLDNDIYIDGTHVCDMIDY